MILLPMPVFFVNKSLQKKHIVAKIKGFTAIFNSFKMVTQNIANMHREHDVSVFSNIVKNIEVDVFQNIA